MKKVAVWHPMYDHVKCLLFKNFKSICLNWFVDLGLFWFLCDKMCENGGSLDMGNKYIFDGLLSELQFTEEEKNNFYVAIVNMIRTGLLSVNNGILTSPFVGTEPPKFKNNG